MRKLRKAIGWTLAVAITLTITFALTTLVWAATLWETGAWQ